MKTTKPEKVKLSELRAWRNDVLQEAKEVCLEQGREMSQEEQIALIHGWESLKSTLSMQLKIKIIID